MDARDARGRRIKVHRMPMPGPLYMTRAEAAGVLTRAGAKPRHARERLAASYINFYVANGGVVAPLLDPRTDKAMLARLRRLFPGREVVGVAAREILLGGGNIHCITQQIPLGRPRAVGAAPAARSR
jgi:agmatine deiminase